MTPVSPFSLREGCRRRGFGIVDVRPRPAGVRAGAGRLGQQPGRDRPLTHRDRPGAWTRPATRARADVSAIKIVAAGLQTRVLDRAIIGQGRGGPQNRCKVLHQSGVRRRTRLAVGRDDDANSGSRVDDVSFHSVASLYGCALQDGVVDRDMFGNRDFCDGLKTGARPWWNSQRWGASSRSASPPCRSTRRSNTSPPNQCSGSTPDQNGQSRA